MAQKTKNGGWINRNGREVDPKYIPKKIKRRDKTVTQIISIAERLQTRMVKDKERMKKLLDNYCKYAADMEGNANLTPEGNLQVSDYSNLLQVSLSMSSLIGFDEQLNIAKGIINKCISKWSKGLNSHIKALVDNAFKLDKKGNLNRSVILQLCTIEINDQDWKKAIELIRKSIYTIDTRQYLKIAKRNSNKEKFTSINLDISTL